MPGYGSMTGGASSDLGLGTALADQVAGETEDEKRRRKLGLAQSDAAQALFGYGRTGIAPLQLGMGQGGAGR